MSTTPLHVLAYARSGDKGDVCTVGLMAKSPAIYAFLTQALSPDGIKAHFGQMVSGPVEIYRLDLIESLSIVLRGGLGGGATTTLRYDQTGKSMGAALLRMEIDAPDLLIEEAKARTHEIEGGAQAPQSLQSIT